MLLILGVGVAAGCDRRSSPPGAGPAASTSPVFRPERAEADGGSPAEVAVPAIPAARLLGMTRANIQARLAPFAKEDKEGWVRYGSALAIRYRSDRAIEVAMRVPAGKTCEEAAQWAGFEQPGPPLRRSDRCVWPTHSEKHLLSKGRSGALDLASGTLSVQIDP